MRVYLTYCHVFLITGSMNVADRNGSLETNESSSPEASQHSDPDDSHASVTALPKQQDFDFGDFLKMSNIPGLGSISMVSVSMPVCIRSSEYE